MDAKEAFMNPMAHLLPSGVHSVKTFIQELVQIDQREGENHGSYVCDYDVICMCDFHVTSHNDTIQ